MDRIESSQACGKRLSGAREDVRCNGNQPEPLQRVVDGCMAQRDVVVSQKRSQALSIDHADI